MCLCDRQDYVFVQSYILMGGDVFVQSYSLMRPDKVICAELYAYATRQSCLADACLLCEPSLQDHCF